MINYRLFSGSAWLAGNGVSYCGVWFRIYGYGPHISTKRRSEALFSERNRLRNALYLFGLRFEWLTP